MSKKILINARDAEECRVAIVAGQELEEFYLESAAREITQGNIYKGVITRIEPSLQAVFVDYGAERHGFLQRPEIHSDYYQPNANEKSSLRNLVKKGQEMLVQVTKDPIGSKGAMLTTFLSLPGRYAVLMPGSASQGISRKIETESERERIKDIITGMKLPEEYGLIIRTAGENCTKTDLVRDIKSLQRLWLNIKSQVMKVPTPALLFKDRNLAMRSVRDWLTPDVDEILIDDPIVFEDVKEFVKLMTRKQPKMVKFYDNDQPLFTKYNLEEKVKTIFESRVKLKSGATIVIEQTEAMVTIDVNSGKSTQKNSVEATAFQTNMEAAAEIARQLKLRDMGGLIVVDFIDMRENSHRLEVEKTLRASTKGDRARTKVGRISSFGLLEMSRQRLHPSIEFGSFQECPCCKGKGLVLSTETLALAFLRRISFEAAKTQAKLIRGILPMEVASYLVNHKRRELSVVEDKQNVIIEIEASAKMYPGDSQIIYI